jgi:hypothetical protein
MPTLERKKQNKRSRTQEFKQTGSDVTRLSQKNCNLQQNLWKNLISQYFVHFFSILTMAHHTHDSEHFLSSLITVCLTRNTIMMKERPTKCILKQPIYIEYQSSSYMIRHCRSAIFREPKVSWWRWRSCSTITCRSKSDILNIWFTLKLHFVGLSS